MKWHAIFSSDKRRFMWPGLKRFGPSMLLAVLLLATGWNLVAPKHQNGFKSVSVQKAGDVTHLVQSSSGASPTPQLISPSIAESNLSTAETADESTSPIATAEPTALPGEMAVVKRAVDGDTIELTTGQKVRYVGVDTPETVDPRKPVQCFGKEASAANKALVEGKTVRLVKDVSDTDKYGRLLRYVYVGDMLVNEELVRQGYARVYVYPPDVALIDEFCVAETEARNAGRGLWSACL